jgi:hypothetical protein
MTTSVDKTLDNILAENYLGLGAIGSHAIMSIWDDFTNKAHETDDWITEQGISERDLAHALIRLTAFIIDSDLLDKMNTPDGWMPVS